MKSSRCWLILLGLIFVHNCFSVPVSNTATDAELTNRIEEEEEEEDEEDDSLILEDDFTTHGLERLSSAATCLVAGVEYTHGQQIYRKDPCEFCLCLDGEMFCWWQDCPPTLEGPCRDRGPFSPCLSIPANPLAFGSSSLLTSSLLSESILTSSSFLSTTSEITTKTNAVSSSNVPQSTAKPLLTSQHSILEKVTQPPSTVDKTSTDMSSKLPESTTFKDNRHCFVMGREYQIGDKLPHDTGNCLECICGQGAKVTCSPHQCTPVEDDMNDYHMTGAVQPAVPDIF